MWVATGGETIPLLVAGNTSPQQRWTRKRSLLSVTDLVYVIKGTYLLTGEGLMESYQGRGFVENTGNFLYNLWTRESRTTVKVEEKVGCGFSRARCN